MPRLIWSPEALGDVERLYRFLVPKSRDAAKRAAMTIRQAVKILVDHPAIGRPIENMPPEFRELPIGFGAGGYLALYRFDGREVVVLAVRHAREAGF